MREGRRAFRAAQHRVRGTLRGIRHAILDGASVGAVWGDIWPLIVIGVVAAPLGIWVFRRGELHAKKHGKLKRSG